MVKMVITDLDGTLLNSDQKVSETDFNSLLSLGEKGIVRVIATGRSPYSFSKVIPLDFPIDYLVFSSGAGIMNWKSREILMTHSLGEDKVHELVTIFKRENIAFKVLDPAPENHKYVFFKNGDVHADFEKRMVLYRGHEKEISFDPPNYGKASQFLIILPANVEEFNRLSALCEGVKVIRATSPLDHNSIWMEVFHPDVSKGNACDYLCKSLGLTFADTIAVGNDYNDIDLLQFASQSYVVENTPDDLKANYTVVSSHNKNGFTSALSRAGIKF